MTRRARHLGLIAVAVAVLAGSWLVSRAILGSSIMAAASSTTVALIVIAHLGVLAALIAPFAIRRRRSRGRQA